MPSSLGLLKGRRGVLALNVRMHRFDGVAVSTVTSPADSDFVIHGPPDAWHLMRVMEGAFEWGQRSGGVAVIDSACCGVMVDSLELAGGRLLAGTVLDCISFEVSLLHAQLATLLGAPVGARIHFSDDLRDQQATVRVLQHIGAAMSIGAEAPGPLAITPGAATELRNALVAIVLGSVHHSYADRLAGSRLPPLSPGHVKRAADFMRAHARESISLEEIARAAGTSKRTLQMSFQRFNGCTPTDFLRDIRLEGARADLLNDQETASVAQIAERWGFNHPGVFSARYRAAYGELPRVTRSRRD